MAANAHLRGVIGENETGFRGKDDVLYRTEGWAFLLAGGGLYNNLDYSFTPAHPDGTFLDYSSPGGGNPAFRKQMRILKDFVHSFDFVRMKPDRSVVAAPEGLAVQALVEKGRQYAVYLHAPVGDGNFAARWTGRLDPPAPAPTGSRRCPTTASGCGWTGSSLIENWTDHATDGGPRDGRADGGTAGRSEARVLPGRRRLEGPAEVDAAGRDDRGDPGVRLRQPDGSGPGLRAEYFEGRTFDAPGAVRVDPTVDFEWPPAPRPIPRKAASGRGRRDRPRPPGRALPGRVGRPEDRKGPEGRVPGARRWPQVPDLAGFRRGRRAGRPHPVSGSTVRGRRPSRWRATPGVC